MEIGMRQKILVLSISIALVLFVVELVRREKLKERYSLVWLITVFGILIITINDRVVLVVMNYFGILVPSNMLLFAGVIFLVLISLNFSVKISAITDRTRLIAQELALLREELKTLRTGKSVAKNTTGP